MGLKLTMEKDLSRAQNSATSGSMAEHEYSMHFAKGIMMIAREGSIEVGVVRRI